MYGSIKAVKDNLPKVAPYIKPDAEAQGKLDVKESSVIQYLEEYSSQVDAALANLYTVPITGDLSLKMLGTIVSNLAAVKLAGRYYQSISTEENHSLTLLRDEAQSLIRGLISGDYKLPDAAAKAADRDPILAEIEEASAAASTEFFDLEDPASWQDKI